jgi:formylglycine-generating enzyme required for sulfatase activity
MRSHFNKKILLVTFICYSFLINTISCQKHIINTQEHSPSISVSFTNSIGMVFKKIPAGTFMMGSPLGELERYEDEIQHQVTLTKSYYIQTTEVTQRQWKAVMGNNPSRNIACGVDCPVEYVSWNDVQEFIKKLNRRNEGVYRLPTEAEWEYAARAGTLTAFNTGDCLSTDDANFHGNSGGADINDTMTYCLPGEYRSSTLPSTSFKPNAWGLYDMHGNVSEFVQDWYGEYSKEEVKDPVGPTTGKYKITRDCNWYCSIADCRSAGRTYTSLNGKSALLGFRLVLEDTKYLSKKRETRKN